MSREKNQEVSKQTSTLELEARQRIAQRIIPPSLPFSVPSPFCQFLAIYFVSLPSQFVHLSKQVGRENNPVRTGANPLSSISFIQKIELTIYHWTIFSYLPL